MTPERVRLYIELLKEIQEGGYLIPDAPNNEAFDVTHGTFSMWAPELVITQQALDHDGLEILLAPYNGAGKMALLNGQYHLPGGYNRIDNWDIADVCNRIAMRELGTEVYIPSPSQPLWIKWWRPWKHGNRQDEHPIGRPLSVFLAAILIGPIEKLGWKFYPVNHLPRPMVGPHEEFIKTFLRGGRARRDVRASIRAR